MEIFTQVHKSDISAPLAITQALRYSRILAGRYTVAGMKPIPDIRRSNLRLLVSRFGSVKALADKLDKAPSQISQWLNASPDSRTGKPRSISNRSAREIERKLSIDPAWMDHPRIEGGVRECPDVEYNTGIHARVPLISRTTAGHWDEIAGSFTEADAEDWIETTARVGPHAFALRIRGESMEPTIPDGATVIVDPDAEPHHRSVVVVRQNHDSEATCKRLIYEDGRPTIRPDNPAWRGQVAPLSEDAMICGVVRRVEIDLD